MAEPVLNQYYPGGVIQQIQDWANQQPGTSPGANAPGVFVAARDPLATDDSTQGVGVGSRWLNTTASGTAEFTCLSNAAGAAVWSYGGCKVGDPELSGVRTQIGSVPRGTVGGSFAEEGNVYRNAAAPIKGNGADTTDDILGGFQLPANSFDAAGRELILTALGNLGATANNKRIKVWVNPTMSGQTVNADGSISGGTVTAVGGGVLIYDSTVITNNNAGWNLAAQITKFGAANSNTQQYQTQPILGTVHGGVSLASALNQPENAVMNFVITGASPTTGAANDVTLNQIALNWCN
jgi:hypothetical protein